MGHQFFNIVLIYIFSATFWSRIMISRGFEAVNTVFGGYFGFGKKKPHSLRERDVVKHGPYTGLMLAEGNYDEGVPWT
jgi:hypothetical protein